MTETTFRSGWTSKFAAAWSGIRGAWVSEKSLQVHGFCAVLVLGVAAISGLTATQWAVLGLTIGLVIVAEMLNTAIEAAVDLCSPEYSELARTAKDTAAGAVLLAAITAIAVGGLILVPAWWPA